MVDVAGHPAGTASTVVPELAESSESALLGLARRAVADALGGADMALVVDELPADLRQPAGAFVTIRRAGELRACMGHIDPETPLWANVVGAAQAAARSDPRFEPVRLSELPDLHLEVSVLGPMAPLAGPEGFVPGRHGIVIEHGWQRGLLLPQVATEHGWGAREMLEAVCRKAGLPADAWRRRGSRLLVFAARVVSEPGGASGS